MVRCQECKEKIDKKEKKAYWGGNQVCQYCHRRLKYWSRLGKKPPEKNGFIEEGYPN